MSTIDTQTMTCTSAVVWKKGEWRGGEKLRTENDNRKKRGKKLRDVVFEHLGLELELD